MMEARNFMQNYAILEKIGAQPQTIELLGAYTLSLGAGVEMTGRYSCDASRVPQGLSRRSQNTPQTASLTLAFSPQICAAAGVRVFDYIAQIEGIVGQKMRLFWCGSEIGSFVVKSAQFSAATDPLSGLSDISAGLSLIEGVVDNPQPTAVVTEPVAVRTLSGV